MPRAATDLAAPLPGREVCGHRPGNGNTTILNFKPIVKAIGGPTGKGGPYFRPCDCTGLAA